MTTTQTVRLTEPRDLIAHIPYRLGFHPAESAVLVVLHLTPRGTRQVGLVARMDLADLAGPGTGASAASVLAGHVAACEPDEVQLVLYTGIPDDSWRLHRVVDHLAEALDEALWPLAPDLDPWLVGPEAWRHLSPCSCCPAPGRPLDELSASPAALAMAVAGVGVAEDRADLGVERVRDAGALGVAHEAGQRARERRAEVLRVCGGAPLVRGAAFGAPGARAAHDQAPLRRWRQEQAELWDSTVASAVTARPGHGTSPDTLGRLLVGLGDKIVRDAVVAATMAGRSGRAADHLDPDTLVRSFETEAPPDGDVVGDAIALAHAVATHAEPGAGGAALGLLAYLAWWGNEGARAEVVARQALSEEPGHRLAELVVTALEAGMPPAWVRRF